MLIRNIGNGNWKQLDRMQKKRKQSCRMRGLAELEI